MLFQDLEQILKSLSEGKLIAYPTETVWGIGADIAHESAVERIYEIKGRAQTKAISLLVKDVEMAEKYAVTDSSLRELMYLFWPGPLTFVVEAKDTVPQSIHGGSGFVGLRCSNHPFVHQLMKRFPRAITSTSANLTGSPAAKGVEDLNWLPEEVVVSSWNGKTLGGIGSTVIRVKEKQVEVLRSGDLDPALLQPALSKRGYCL